MRPIKSSGGISKAKKVVHLGSSSRIDTEYYRKRGLKVPAIPKVPRRTPHLAEDDPNWKPYDVNRRLIQAFQKARLLPRARMPRR